MNVLIISHMYPSTFNNMSGIFVHKQVKELISMGCNVTVISPVPWSGFPINVISNRWKQYYNIPKKDIIDGVEVYYPRYIEFPKGYFFYESGKRMFKGIWDLVYELHKKNKFDLIHSHVALPDGYCGMFVKHKLSLPHVVTIHGQDFQYTINKGEIFKNRVFEVLEDSDKIIVVSNKLRKIVRDSNFIEKVQVINNGIDVEDCIDKDGHENHIPKDIDILSVSNLIKTKGIDLNIKAMHKLKVMYPNLKYYIIGDGPEKENLIKMVETYDLEKNVFFTGKLPHKEVMKYMRNCKIFSLPSWQEGFGVVYVECMLQQKPVIAVKGEGIEDVINHMENGILVEPKNVEDIIKSIEFLIKNNKVAMDIGIKAKETVINNFTWKNSANSILKLYNDII